MTWSPTDTGFECHFHGLHFRLIRTDWSLWDLSQAKAAALHLGQQKANGLANWVTGAGTVFFFRDTGKP